MKKILALVIVVGLGLVPFVTSAHIACQTGDLFNSDTGARCGALTCQPGDLYDSQTGQSCSDEVSGIPQQGTIGSDTLGNATIGGNSAPAPTCTLTAQSVQIEAPLNPMPVYGANIQWTSTNAISGMLSDDLYKNFYNLIPVSGGSAGNIVIHQSAPTNISIDVQGPGGDTKCNAIVNPTSSSTSAVNNIQSQYNAEYQTYTYDNQVAQQQCQSVGIITVDTGAAAIQQTKNISLCSADTQKASEDQQLLQTLQNQITQLQ